MVGGGGGEENVALVGAQLENCVCALHRRVSSEVPIRTSHQKTKNKKQGVRPGKMGSAGEK